MMNKNHETEYELGNIVYMSSRDNMSQQDKLNDSNYFSGIKSGMNSEHSHDINDLAKYQGKVLSVDDSSFRYLINDLLVLNQKFDFEWNLFWHLLINYIHQK